MLKDEMKLWWWPELCYMVPQVFGCHMQLVSLTRQVPQVKVKDTYRFVLIKVKVKYTCYFVLMKVMIKGTCS